MQYSKQASNFVSFAFVLKTQMASVKAVLESGKDNPYEQYKVRHCNVLDVVLQDSCCCAANLCTHAYVSVWCLLVCTLAVLQCMYDKKKRAVSEEVSRAFCSYTVSYCAALCLALAAHCGTESLLMHT
jgi:hypothetical protein